MPRVIRDSDDDVEIKGVVRRTRASTAVNSVTSDSPVTRRSTRSTKQLSITESSPESLDDGVTQRTRPATRSRTATLDKTAPITTRSLRSRKNSASSDQSETTLVDVETGIPQKRVTRNKVALLDAGTPTKTNPRSRSIRAGSEAKSTPPARIKRVTRANSADPVGLNESTGTPIKRVTRTSMVLLQPTVTEEQEAKNKPFKSLENSFIEVDEDDSETTSSKKAKSTYKSNVAKEIEEDTSINADAENASSLQKLDQIKDDSASESTPSESPKEQKKENQRRKLRPIISESEDNDENLFQDVLPEEYTAKKSPNGKSVDDAVINKSDDLNNSNANHAASEGSDDSLKKKSHRLILDSQDSEESANKTVIENVDVDDEVSNKSLNKSRRSANKSLKLNQSSSKQKKNDGTPEKLSDSSIENKSPNKSRKSLNKSVNLINFEQNENDIAEELPSENKSLNKSRRSLDKSAKLNQSSEENHNENSSNILDGNRSSCKSSTASNKSSKSLDKSMKMEFQLDSKNNESTSEKLSTSLNNSKSSKRGSLSDSLKLLPENQIEKIIEDEPMDVDVPMEIDEINDQKNESENINDKSLNRSQHSLHKNQHNKSKNESMSEKLSASLNNSKTYKRLSLGNSKNNSLQRSNVIEDEDSSSSEDDNNTSVKNCKSLTKEELQDKNDSIKKILTVSLNDIKKDKPLFKKLELLKESTWKPSVEQVSVEIFSDNEAEINQDSEVSSNKLQRLSQSLSAAKPDASSRKNDKSSRNTSLRKSLNKSVSASNLGDSSENETEYIEYDKKLNKSTNKSLNVSKKDLKFTNISSVNSPAKASITENGEDLDTFDLMKDEPSVNDLSESILSSIERMKYANPTKHDISTLARIDSESEDENHELVLEEDNEASDIEFNEESSANEIDSEDEDDLKSIDSDIEREYNLGGKAVTKFSDDDVPGDNCRASEEEFSDSEDEGKDLTDFIVSDDGIESDGSEDDETEDSEVDDDTNDEDTVDEADETEGDEKVIEEEAESTDEEELSEVEIKKDKSVNLSKSLINKSLKDSYLLKNKSLNNSKTGKDKSNLSKNGSFTINKAQSLEQADLRMSTMIIEPSTESDSASEKLEDSYRIILSEPINPSEPKVQNKTLGHLIECSTPKPGVNKKSTDRFVDKVNRLSILNNKSISTRRKSVSLDNLMDTQLINSRLSIGSIKDHDSSKIQSEVNVNGSPEAVLKNRQSWKLVPLNKTAQVGDETPVTKYLKKVKLNDTLPVLESMRTCGLSDFQESKKKDISKNSKRKSLLSRSFVNAENDIAAEENEGVDKKSKKRESLPNKSFMNAKDAAPAEDIEAVGKKSKKRKVKDVSHIASLDNEAMIKTLGKKKKRARIEESTNQKEEAEQIQEPEQIEEVKTKKKKKKNESKFEVEENVEEILESSESRETKQKMKTKKKNKNKSLDATENDESTLIIEPLKSKSNKSRLSDEKAQEALELSAEAVKSKKKKSRSFEEKFDQENSINKIANIKKKSNKSSDSVSSETDKKSKKNKNVTVTESDDEAPEAISFKDARYSALSAMQRAAEDEQAMKVARKKKHQEHIESMHKQEPVRRASLKRLPEDILDSLTDDAAIGQAHKRQKLSRSKERKYLMPSTSMFSPGKPKPTNLKVDDAYAELSNTGGTTQFGVVNLAKMNKSKIPKSSIAALNFRQKMLARNARQPISAYHVYQQKLKAKSGL